MLVKVVAVQ